MYNMHAQHLGHYLEGQSHSMTVQPNCVRPHNFVISSRTLQRFHRNDHHIDTKCRAQHLGRYLEGQGHSMTLQQNRVVIQNNVDFSCRNDTFHRSILKL